MASGLRSRWGAVLVCSLAFLVFANLRSSQHLSLSVQSCDLPQAPSFFQDETKNISNSDGSTCDTLCDCFALQTVATDVISTPSSIWKKYSNEILNASIRVEEAQNKSLEYQRWVHHLFAQTLPSRLVKSFETFPQDIRALNSLSSILQKRFLRKDEAPPLKVAVFGGSLTAGHGCLENPLGLATQSFLKRQLPCAWPARVQHLLDTFLPPTLVNITNMAMAATTSDVGATVVEYQLWPPELQPDGPDVIVASFATNDALAEAPETEIYQNMQALIEAINRERNCRDDKLPVLIYIDDFIAWPGSVQKWLDFHHDLHELADWHGFGYISYANAFRDLIQADLLNENTFKGEWKKEKRGKYSANPHPGLSFHFVMSWIVSYNILKLGFHICDGSLEEKVPVPNPEFPMVAIPSVRRPRLHPDLKTENIPQEWKDLETSEKVRCSSIQPGPRCAFVWVANRVSEFRTAAAIETFLNKFMTQNDGWKAEGNSYRSKHGWVAQKENARFELEIPSLQTDASYLTILSLRSYGEQWKDSRLKLTVNGLEVVVEGFHDSETSVILPNKFKLPNRIAAGEAIKIIFELIGGKTFKITGMALCSQ